LDGLVEVENREQVGNGTKSNPATILCSGELSNSVQDTGENYPTEQKADKEIEIGSQGWCGFLPPAYENPMEVQHESRA